MRSSSLTQEALLAGSSGLSKFVFGHARGAIGLEFEGLIVGRVAGQARKLGVRPGWKIHTVDGHNVHSDEEVFLRLQEAKWQWRSCCVWFATDTTSIRAEQARARAAAIQAEVERLAKLPFEGHEDSRHLGQIKEEFTFQGYIDHVEDRAITLRQLRRIRDWATDRCHRWRDAGSKEASKTYGQKLHLNFMNLHHINHWLIRPSTKEKDCSFVEMLTSQKQPAEWFVVHWWGERLVDFMKSLEAHIDTRRLSDTSGYWVSAYAMRQHALNQDGAGSDDATAGSGGSYFRAMSATKFRVVLTLDSATTAFNRLWCDLEAYFLVLQEEAKPQLDIVINQGGLKPAMITKGLTESEAKIEASNPGAGYKAKLDREKAFDPEIIFPGLSLHVHNAHVTDQADRRRILNSIAERDVNLQPLEDHENYHKLNRRLRGLFALTSWSRIMGGGDADGQLQAKLSSALRADTERKTLELSLGFCASFEEKMVALLRSLPPNLRKLRLDLKGTGITDDRLLSLAAGLPPGLEELELDVSHNSHVTNAGVTTFTGKLPPKMREQVLTIESTAVTKEMSAHTGSLAGLRQHILDEATKGTLCTMTSLVPNREGNKKTGSMDVKFTRGKC
jgi:hypothetical protein